MVLALVSVADLSQADGACHVLELAIAVGGAGQAVERMVGDVEFHHALADLLETVGLGRDHHAGRDRRRAGGRRAVAAFDLDQTKPAGAECLDRIGGAELGHLNAGIHGSAHDRGAGRDRHLVAVDGELDRRGRLAGGRAMVDLVRERHEPVL